MVVGYVYSADVYCPRCILCALHNSPSGEPPISGMSVEQHLDVLARIRGIDRYDESSYDSGEFPKVILDLGDEEQCGRCGETF